jgi:AbrB family looped-hinge helix DNA binding protein
MNVRLSQKGWIVIPAALRKKYGLKPGANLQVVDYGGVLSIIPAMRDPIQQGRGLLKDLPSLTEDVLKEHAEELAREEARIKRLNG